MRADVVDQDSLQTIVSLLQHHRQAATYEALAGVTGRTPGTVLADEPRSFRNSWIVDRKSRRPIGFEPEQLHPQLLESIAAHGVIETPEHLADWLAAHPEFTPRDDWERGLLALAKDYGYSPPPEAFSSDGMYD